MKKVLVMCMMVALVAAAQAAVIDDFDSYTVGGILNENNSGGIAGCGWFGSGDNTGTSNIKVVAPLAGDLAAGGWGTSSGSRGIYKSALVTEGTAASLKFDLYSDGQQVHFGFATDRDGSVPKPYADYEAFAGLKSDGLGGLIFEARDGGANWTYGSALTPSQWYSIELLVYTNTDTYSVLLDGDVVASGLRFRINTGETVHQAKDLETILLNLNRNAGLGAVDNIELTAIAVPEPATMALLGLGGLVLRRRK